MNITSNKLKHVLILMLTLCILGYSAVWAGTIQSEHSTDSEQHHSQDVETTPEHANHDVDSDHCCHASAHLVGLLVNGLTYQNTGTQVVPDSQFPFYSRNISPPYRPPLA